MDFRLLAAVAFIVLAALITAFQVALALGAPWGAYAMGGASPGRFPPRLRVGALIQALLWLAFIGVIAARSGIGLPAWASAARWLAWVIVGVAAVSLVLNLITPSAGERLRWAPVAFAVLVCAVLVASGPVPSG